MYIEGKAVALVRDGLPCIWGLEMVEEHRSKLPVDETHWAELTLRALRELGGDSQMVVGAKLRQKMVALARERDLDVEGYVGASRESFSGLVEQVDGVVVRRRSGRDVLVGTPQAEEPKLESGSSTRRGALRGDVYQAFTRVAPVPVVYSPEADRFLFEENAEGRTIRVPEITLDTLVQDRRQFVESLDPETQRPLLDALTRSPNPLVAFRQAVERLGMLDRWGLEQSRIIWRRVETWAGENGVTPRTSWYGRGQTGESAHRTLSRLAEYMTANEIRQLKIPFRAVEAFLSDHDRR